MCDITLYEINIRYVNYDHISFHLVTEYDYFNITDDTFKIFFRGYVGESEVKSFFHFFISFIVSNIDENQFMICEVYCYLCDLLITIIFLQLDII